MKYVIGKRQASHRSGIGFIQPFYYVNEKLELIYVNNTDRPEVFPNKGFVIVLKNYADIYDYFESKEFFILEIEKSPNYEEYTPNSARYQSLDGNSDTARKLPLLIKKSFTVKDNIFLPYSGHTYVFIEDGDFIYGPISIYQIDPNQEEPDGNIEYSIDPLNTVDLELKDEFSSVIFKYRRDQLKHWIVDNYFGYNDTNELYIFGAREIVNSITPEEYILNETDERIIEWAGAAFPDGFAKEKLESWLTTNSGDNVVAQMRLARLAELKNNTASWLKFIDSFITTQFINTAPGKQVIEQYITNNKDELLKDFENKARTSIDEKLKQETDDLSSVTKTLAGEKDKLESIKEEIKKLSDQKEILYSKSEELKGLESQIESKREELKIITGYEEIKVEYQKRQDAFYILNTDYINKKKELEELVTEYNNKAKEGTHKKVVELMPYVKALTGYIPDSENKDSSGYKFSSLSMMRKEAVDVENYFLRAKQFLASNGRDMSEVAVGNLFTCIHQNFLTVLAGLPGVGKSSLATLVGNYLSPNELHVDVSVGRGWTSRKNLLGFYNSLKGEYQLDDFGIVQRLKTISSNPELVKDLPLTICLDEANLSAIEHYWSDFLGVSDKEAERLIHTGDSRNSGSLNLPDGLRFIFTINSDHTTESLSPRLLDRGTIIKLEYDINQSSELNLQESSKVMNDFFYSYQSIKQAFFPEVYSLNQSEKRHFTDLLTILSDKDFKYGSQIPVSPRKIKAISRYCSVVRKFFSKYQDNNQFLALDLAITQNILPLISGTGKGFEQRLEKLREACVKRSLLKSSQEIGDIISRGKEFQNYSYF